MPSTGDLSAQYNLVIRTLSTGVEHLYPMLPAGQSSGLPAPISHLSWAPGGHQLAVSIAAIQDNEGWQIVLMDPAVAQSYLAGTGDTSVPVTGPGPPAQLLARGGVPAQRAAVRQPGLLRWASRSAIPPG